MGNQKHEVVIRQAVHRTTASHIDKRIVVHGLTNGVDMNDLKAKLENRFVNVNPMRSTKQVPPNLNSISKETNSNMKLVI